MALKIFRPWAAKQYFLPYLWCSCDWFFGEPLIQCLGEDFNQVQIGQICTPIGTLSLSVSYRTKMTISPTQTGRQNSIMLKSDHFNTKSSPKTKRNHQNEDKTTSLGNAMKTGAFAEQKKIESHLIIPNTPFSQLFKENVKIPDRCAENDENGTTELKNGKNGIQETNGNSVADNLTTKLKSLTMVSTNDDFIMVDLKTPFASTNEKSELGKFYREWQSAPPLQTFVELSPLDELDVSRQLETFESDLTEFDTVVQSLCHSSTK